MRIGRFGQPCARAVPAQASTMADAARVRNKHFMMSFPQLTRAIRRDGRAHGGASLQMRKFALEIFHSLSLLRYPQDVCAGCDTFPRADGICRWTGKQSGGVFLSAFSGRSRL